MPLICFASPGGGTGRATPAAPLLPRPPRARAAVLPAIKAGRFAGTLVAEQQMFVINRWGAPGGLAGVFAEAMCRHPDPRLIGAVRTDEAVANAWAAQRLVGDQATQSVAATNLVKLSASILLRLESCKQRDVMRAGLMRHDHAVMAPGVRTGHTPLGTQALPSCPSVARDSKR